MICAQASVGAAYAANVTDSDVAALYAEALLLTECDSEGYHFYVGGRARPATVEALAVLERVLASGRAHAMCEHLYVHATEQLAPSFSDDDKDAFDADDASNTTALRGVAAAERLARQFAASDAQHLQHMPAHVFLRVGRYADAVTASVAATRADAAFNAHARDAYGVGHDLVFLVFNAAMCGMKATALDYADRLQEAYARAPDRRDGPGPALAWHSPLLAAVRFGDWERVLRIDADHKRRPPRDWPLQPVLQNYARGLVSFGRGGPPLNLCVCFSWRARVMIRIFSHSHTTTKGEREPGRLGGRARTLRGAAAVGRGAAARGKSAAGHRERRQRPRAAQPLARGQRHARRRARRARSPRIRRNNNNNRPSPRGRAPQRGLRQTDDLALLRAPALARADRAVRGRRLAQTRRTKRKRRRASLQERPRHLPRASAPRAPS